MIERHEKELSKLNGSVPKSIRYQVESKMSDNKETSSKKKKLKERKERLAKAVEEKQ